MKIQQVLIGRVLAVLMLITVALPVAPAAQAADGVTLVQQVITPYYDLTSDSVEVPDYSFNIAEGAPRLPLKGLIFELPYSGEWSLSFKSTASRVLPDTMAVAAVPVANLSSEDLASIQSGSTESLVSAIPTVDRPDPAIYGVDAFYPATPVVTGKVVQQGDKRLLFAQVFPFQYNPVTQQLLYNPSIEVTVQVNGVQAAPERASLMPDDFLQPTALPGDGILRVHTKQQGLYKLTYTDLSNAGVPVGPSGVKPSTFAMYYKGQQIAIEVRGVADNSFDAGDLVIFYAVPYDGGRYQDYNIYQFAYGANVTGTRIATRAVTSATSPTAASVVSQLERVENNVNYKTLYRRDISQEQLFDYDMQVNASFPSSVRTYSFALEDVVTNGGAAQIKAVFWGQEYHMAAPDNSVAFSFNSYNAGTFQWDGRTETTINATLPQSSLSTSSNQLTMTAALAQLSGVDSYTINPDWVEITYPAKAEAESDQIYIRPQTSLANPVAVSGFSATTVTAYDVRDPYSVKKLSGIGTTTIGTRTVYWSETVSSPTYVVTTDAGLLVPGAIERDTPSNWASASNAYTYLIIVGTERYYTGTTALGSQLKTAIQPLATYRGSEFNVATIDVQDIYDEFSYGRLDAEAIRSFLATAYFTWVVPPKFVLLVGDGHYDFNRTTAHTLPVVLPSYLVDTDPFWGEVPADIRFATVDSASDLLPNFPIGRLPAVTAANVTAVVDKIIAYENVATNPDGAWQTRTSYIADNCSDVAGDTHEYSNELRSNWLSPRYTSVPIYYNPSGICASGGFATSATGKTLIKNEFNNGALFLQWFGHGTQFRWGSSTGLWSVTDPATLNANTQLPFTMANACLSGSFVAQATSSMVNKQSFSENTLMAAGRGSIADIGPSGLHTGFDLLLFAQGVHEAMFDEEIKRVGTVGDYARTFFIAHATGNTESFTDIVDTMVLFGDPALKLRYNPVVLSTLEVTFNVLRDWVPAGYNVQGFLELAGGETGSQVDITIDLPSQVQAPTSLTANNFNVSYNAATHRIISSGSAPSSTEEIGFAAPVDPSLQTCSSFTINWSALNVGTTQTGFATVNVAVPDVNCSGTVTVADIQEVAAHWGSASGDAVYHPRYDLNADDVIDVADIVAVVNAWH